MECLVRDDGGLEGRRDALGQQRLPRDGGEERVPLHALDAVGACAEKQEASMQGDTSGSSLGLVNIYAKVKFEYMLLKNESLCLNATFALMST